MILRLLIAATLVLMIAKFYIYDSKTDNVKPKQQIENIENEIDSINKKAEDIRNKALKEMDL